VALLDISGLDGRESVTLDGERVTIGKNDDLDVVIADDPSVSRVHAVLERISGGRWLIRDVGSTNGTLVNGERILGERVLRDDDEIILGRTRLRFCDRTLAGESSTERTGAKPRLTPKEHDVLVELCRPVMSGRAFTQPATVREVADRLFVTEAAVKQHLGHLYDKFGIMEEDDGVPRRARLANAALETGAVTMSDIKATSADVPE
jgi:pSer/pThr/pTyr-binding forkhead associated (FHA) protein